MKYPKIEAPAASAMVASAALAMTLSLMGPGCAYVNAARSPINVRATGKAPTTAPGPDNVDAWSIEAKSSSKSHVSGRNNLTLRATITTLSPDRVEVLALLTSTEKLNLDPNHFYVELNAGKGWANVETIELGAISNQPYNYKVQVPVRVEAGVLQYGDGSTTTVYKTELREEKRSEDYFTRPVRLIFASRGVFKSAAEKVQLRIRDLGVNMSVTWMLGGRGGAA